MLDSDQQHWFTYAEAGELLGISAQAARMLAKRRGWARRTPNAYGDLARVQVPEDACVQPRAAVIAVRTAPMIDHDPGGANGLDQVNVRVLEQAVEVLREQLGAANKRSDDQRARGDRAEQQVASLLAELAAVRVAVEVAEYATAEVTDLRRRLDAEAEERREQLNIANRRADAERTRAERAELRIAELMMPRWRRWIRW